MSVFSELLDHIGSHEFDLTLQCDDDDGPLGQLQQVQKALSERVDNISSQLDHAMLRVLYRLACFLRKWVST